MSKSNRRAIDPELFTDAQGAQELQANSLRSTLEYDSYGVNDEFDVIVLTQPISMAAKDFQILNGVALSEEALSPGEIQGCLQFKGRIVGADYMSPHETLPNPCNMDSAVDLKNVLRAINLHTTFVSTPGYSGRVPSLGDKVRVVVQPGDIKFNMQHSVFTEITDPVTTDATVSLRNNIGCDSLASRFEQFDITSKVVDYEAIYTDNELEGPGTGAVNDISYDDAKPFIDQWVVEMNRKKELGYTVLPPGKCGFPEDFPNVSDELKKEYSVVNCVEWTMTGAGGKKKIVKGHPKFIETLKKIDAEARKQSWWNEFIKENEGALPICYGNSLRSVQKQMWLRMRNCGHKTYTQVMSSPSKPKCQPATAKPGFSRHQLGLAIDFSCIIGANLDNEASKWLRSKQLANGSDGGDGTFNIKRLLSEPWHFSVDGG